MDIISKDTTPCMYDYAEEYYKLEEYIEKSEGRTLTEEERFMLFAIISQERR